MTPHEKPENIYLIGFMACGKTSVGRALAKRLSRPFIDSDLEIARCEGRPISRIFKEDGETGFRAIEARMIAKLTARRGRVIALGGGAVLRPANARLIRKTGRVIYLQASFASLFKRGERKTRTARPLWTEDRRSRKRAQLRGLLERRHPVYCRVSHLMVRSDRGTVADVARRVNWHLRRRQLLWH